MQRILVIDDRKSMVEMLSRALTAEGYSVVSAHTVTDGKKALTGPEIAAVVTDLMLPDGDGIEILGAVRQRYPFVPVVVMTAHGSIETAVTAVKKGAYDFIAKPFDPEHLVLILKRAIDEVESKKENTLLRQEFSKYLSMPQIVGTSGAWQKVMDKVHKVASLRTTVLVLGESGTGKELVARAVHHLSPRAKASFVAVNCAAIPKDLIESELFGHEKGAFTGATELKPGRFELADRGTIFLDEIGDMDLQLQAKLLRVLQEQEIERVGGTKALKVDVRVIAASNKDLMRAVTENKFREDLLYRLNVFPIVIPPLRERAEDIIPLANHFIGLFCRDMNKPLQTLSEDAAGTLRRHQWKGNVRELKNVIERAVIMCDGTVITPELLALGDTARIALSPDAPLHAVGEAAARIAEKARIEEALRKTGGNKTKAAELLQVSYKTLFNKMKELKIETENDRGV